MEIKGKICVIVYPEKKYVPYIDNVLNRIKDVLNKYNIQIKTLSSAVKPQESNLQTIFNLLKDSILEIVILDGLRPKQRQRPRILIVIITNHSFWIKNQKYFKNLL